jgi:hypothetical protein
MCLRYLCLVPQLSGWENVPEAISHSLSLAWTHNHCQNLETGDVADIDVGMEKTRLRQSQTVVLDRVHRQEISSSEIMLYHGPWNGLFCLVMSQLLEGAGEEVGLLEVHQMAAAYEYYHDGLHSLLG